MRQISETPRPPLPEKTPFAPLQPGISRFLQLQAEKGAPFRLQASRRAVSWVWNPAEGAEIRAPFFD